MNSAVGGASDRSAFPAGGGRRSRPGQQVRVAQRCQKREPDLLVVDARDAVDIAQIGTVPGAVNIFYGALTYLADHEAPESWRDPRLADRSRPIVTTCTVGSLGGLMTIAASAVPSDRSWNATAIRRGHSGSASSTSG